MTNREYRQKVFARENPCPECGAIGFRTLWRPPNSAYIHAVCRKGHEYKILPGFLMNTIRYKNPAPFCLWAYNVKAWNADANSSWGQFGNLLGPMQVALYYHGRDILKCTQCVYCREIADECTCPAASKQRVTCPGCQCSRLKRCEPTQQSAGSPAWRCLRCNVKFIVTNPSYLKHS